MIQYFLNPWLLAGLVGIGLPLAAHLISRRRFDVVDWGAMQFLNPSRKTRRRMQLEELLLLLLRMGVIGLLALAASRPWIPGGWLHGYRSAGSRTVVLVIDGSNSMSRSDGVSSVHQQAVRRATEFLQTLQGGDTVAVVDARDQPLAIVESPPATPWRCLCDAARAGTSHGNSGTQQCPVPRNCRVYRSAGGALENRGYGCLAAI